jgi:hypothetical protein
METAAAVEGSAAAEAAAMASAEAAAMSAAADKRAATAARQTRGGGADRAQRDHARDQNPRKSSLHRDVHLSTPQQSTVCRLVYRHSQLIDFMNKR